MEADSVPGYGPIFNAGVIHHDGRFHLFARGVRGGYRRNDGPRRHASSTTSRTCSCSPRATDATTSSSRYLRPVPPTACTHTRSGKEILMRLELGNPVRCSDGVFGELADVVIDPTTKHVTHLVVRASTTSTGSPGSSRSSWRKPPVRSSRRSRFAARSRGCGGWRRCRSSPTCASASFPLTIRTGTSASRTCSRCPTTGASGLGSAAATRADTTRSVGVSYDRVPKGEVEIRRASAVASADGHRLGHVDGLLVDSEDQITHSCSSTATSGDGARSRFRSAPSPRSRTTRSRSACPRTRRGARAGAGSPLAAVTETASASCCGV